MQSSLKWKLFILVFVVIFSGVAVLPSFYENVPSWWKKYLAPEGLQLGLDLQGGIHLVLKVDLEKAVENGLDLAAQDLEQALNDKGVSVVRTASDDLSKIILTIPNTQALATVEEVKADFPDLAIETQAEEGSFPRIILSLSNDRISFIKKNAINQSLEIIRNRIDQFGVAEPVIIRQGTDEIVVQLPGVKDPERAKDLIKATAQLEFKLVNDTATVNPTTLIQQAIASGEWKWDESREKLNLAVKDQLPPDTEIYFEKTKDKQTGVEQKIPYLLNNPILMTGEMVKDAQVRVGGTFNEPYVSLDLTGSGGRRFGQITEQNVNKRLAIVLDGVVKSAPVIRERILGGSAQITGSFTYEEAQDLAIVLRVGALPAPLKPISELTVGASLGHDSIMKGLMSGLFGTALVLLFMIVYYRLSGVIANVALLLNLLLLFAGLALFKATLTLPGIAGIILTIGMAVDSNVLIFERMREEFALGKSVKSGIDGGYDKAFSTIVDSQVTTLITAFALFLFGTGSIKGFAVTLSLGILINLFTTLFGTRLCYDMMYNTKSLKKLSFLQFVRKPNINYIKLRKFAYILSGVFCLIGLFAFGQILRGEANLGVDFSGGTMMQYKASQSFNLNEVRQAFKQSGLGDINLQNVEGEDRLIVRLKKSEETVGQLSEQITNVLNTNLPDKNFVMESQSEIGSSVSGALRDKALQAIVISMIGVICYLGLRFNFRFGFAAAIATFHDVLVVLGLCYVFDVEITLLIVTALLTLAGYSLNDTVVVFDRIREQLAKTPKENFAAVINESINAVLSRSVITSLTTFLTVAALFFLGGTVIHGFSFALLTGLVVGTYSSVFVASPLLFTWSGEKAEGA